MSTYKLKLAANTSTVYAMRAAESLRYHMDNGGDWHGPIAQSLLDDSNRTLAAEREAWIQFDEACADKEHTLLLLIASLRRPIVTED